MGREQEAQTPRAAARNDEKPGDRDLDERRDKRQGAQGTGRQGTEKPREDPDGERGVRFPDAAPEVGGDEEEADERPSLARPGRFRPIPPH